MAVAARSEGAEVIEQAQAPQTSFGRCLMAVQKAQDQDNRWKQPGNRRASGLPAVRVGGLWLPVRRKIVSFIKSGSNLVQPCIQILDQGLHEQSEAR